MDFIKTSTKDRVFVLENDVKSLIKLISLVHEEALRAYWITRSHCGGDFSESCKPCFAYEQCKGSEQIEKILKDLEV